MSEQPSRPGPPRARPLAELAFDGLLGRVGELSRRWAVVLISERPPEAIGGVALEDLAREAPALMSALLGALRSDGELGLLLEGARSRTSLAALIPALAGAEDPVAVVDAVEALRGVLWEALLDEFGYLASEPGRGTRMADLADRLAAVCAAMLPAALAGPGDPEEQDRQGEQVKQPPVAAASPAPAGGAGPVRRAAGSGAVIVDERAAAQTEAAEGRPAAQAAEQRLAVPALVTEIQIRDERGDEGPAAWTRSIGRQLERYERDGASFAVLLVELQGAPESSWERIEELISAELGAGTMTRERAGRYWLLSPATDRLGAAALASRLSRALEELGRTRGMGLSVAVGTAVCPEDGRRASALAAHADVGLHAARAERRRPLPPPVLPSSAS